MLVSSSLRARQYATRAVFMVPGLGVAIWAALVPFAKARANLDEHTLGLVLLCLGTGSLISVPLAGALAAWQGKRRVLLGGFVLMSAALPCLALGTSPWLIALALFFFGAGIGSLDCAMNLQAVVVERESQRPLMSVFHAFYSIGGFVGAGIMAALLSMRITPLWACLILIAAMSLVMLLSLPHCLAQPLAKPSTPAFAWPRGIVIFLGILCFIIALCESVVLDWSAVFLHEIRHMPLEQASIGFALYSLSVTLVRLLSSAWVWRLGQKRTIAISGALACFGFFIATFMPLWQWALVGYVLIGAGCAHIFPTLFTWAGQQKTMPESLAIPAISTFGYTGVLAGPTLIGLIADATSLIIAFVVTAIAMLGISISMRWIKL